MVGWSWSELGVFAAVLSGISTALGFGFSEWRRRRDDLAKMVDEAVDRKIGEEVGASFFNLLHTQRVLEERAAATLKTLEREAEQHRQEMVTIEDSARATVEAAEEIEARLRVLVERAEEQARRVDDEATAASHTVDSMTAALELQAEALRAELEHFEREQSRLREAEGSLADRAFDKGFPQDVSALGDIRRRLDYLNAIIGDRRAALQRLEQEINVINTTRRIGSTIEARVRPKQGERS